MYKNKIHEELKKYHYKEKAIFNTIDKIINNYIEVRINKKVSDNKNNILKKFFLRLTNFNFLITQEKKDFFYIKKLLKKKEIETDQKELLYFKNSITGLYKNL